MKFMGFEGMKSAYFIVFCVDVFFGGDCPKTPVSNLITSPLCLFSDIL
jgi:hypothetical protein